MPKSISNGLLFNQIHDRLEKQSNNALRKKDLTMMQVSTLMTLQQAENKQLSMKELERYFGVAQSTVVGIVSRLEQKGLVEAFCDVTDKRIKLVHITSAGESCCVEAAFQMEETEKILMHGFSKEEQKELNYLLTKVIENLK